MASTVNREVHGGPADGVKVRVDSTLTALLVPCTITPTTPSLRNPDTRFQCTALYTLVRTNHGDYFAFQSIQN